MDEAVWTRLYCPACDSLWLGSHRDPNEGDICPECADADLVLVQLTGATSWGRGELARWTEGFKAAFGLLTEPAAEPPDADQAP